MKKLFLSYKMRQQVQVHRMCCIFLWYLKLHHVTIIIQKSYRISINVSEIF